MSVQGSIAFLGILELLQTAQFQHRSMQIQLVVQGNPGSIVLDDGRIVHAEHAGETGEAALFRLFGHAPDSQFSLLPMGENTPASITTKTNAILMQAAMRVQPILTPPTGTIWTLEGSSDLLQLDELLQIFENNGRPAYCRLAGPGGKEAGIILAERGIVITPENHGKDEEVVYEALTWDRFSFEMKYLDEPPLTSQQLDIASVICEGLRRQDEAKLRRREMDLNAEHNIHARESLEMLENGELEEAQRLELARRYLPGGEIAPASILLPLALDSSQQVRDVALGTLLECPEPVLEAFGNDEDTPPAVLRFLLLETKSTAIANAAIANPQTPDDALLAYAAKNVAKTAVAFAKRRDALERNRSLRNVLRDNPGCTFHDLLDEIDKTAKPRMRSMGFDKPTATETVILKKPPEESNKKKVPQKLGPKDIQYIVRRGTLRQKMKLICGNESEIAVEVVSQPGLPETFVLSVAECTSSNASALAWIAGSTKYKRVQMIVQALLFNPKTPAHASTPLLNLVRVDTFSAVEGNRDLPDALRQAARRMMEKRAQKKK